MRRQDKEITDPAKLKKILKETKYITIAMAKDSQPYLVSLSHGYDEENNFIYFHCANEGKKLDYLKTNDTVWGQAIIDFGYSEERCTQDFATVMFHGKVSFIDDMKQKRQALMIINKQLRSPSESLEDVLNSNLARTTVGKISIKYLSGKKSKEISI